MSNDPFKLARMAGYYKGVQSAGAAVSFGMDAVSTPYLTELLVSWMLVVFALPLAAFVIYKCSDTNYDKEKVAMVDDLPPEQVPEVALPPGHNSSSRSGNGDAEDLHDKEDAKVNVTAA
jgi:hypothetical protein